MPRGKSSLTPYRQKRQAQRTPEPFGGAVAPSSDALRFVVQKHAATRIHYDFRLEWGNVTLSWAVPRGPALDPKEKRLAVRVEDHPLDYTTFEGVIPAGNYGAGAVIVWDYGRWVPLEDPDAGLQSGKLLFELFGYKLRGVWTLVLPKKNEKDWLLIKKPDAGTLVPQDEASILSGLTVEERGAGGKQLTELSWFKKLPPCRDDIETAGLMLAKRADKPFSDANWLYEVKYDGFRALASTSPVVQLRYRRGLNATGLYPDIARALTALPLNHTILDGELVVHDKEGMPSFGALQDRAMLSDARTIARAALISPATYYVFDVLAWEGRDMRALPLVERKAWLAARIPRRGPVTYVDHVLEAGIPLFEQALNLGLEGLIAKRCDSRYRQGRSDDWLKVPAYLQEAFEIVGYSAPKGTRAAFGALQVAQRTPKGALVYAGAVGTGMDDATLHSLLTQLQPLGRKGAPCAGVPALVKDVQWVEPQLRALVRYKERTREGLLRQPVFVHLTAELRAAPTTREPKEVKLTNTDKIFWPASGHTKGDLIKYYEAIAPTILPYLRDRPVVLTRYPDGIDGKSFFQKDAPAWIPPWLRTVSLYSDEKQRDIAAFVCEDVEGLMYLANMGTIPLHIWSSRIAALGQPDFCILDLDPKDTPFAKVIDVALEIHALCKEVALPAYLKTSGSTGLHVLVPLGGVFTHEQSRQFAGLIGRVVVNRMPKVATMDRVMNKRKGKIYVDTLQNGHGKLIVAPYCVRPVPGALVSTPLSWRELSKRLDFTRYNMDTVPARVAKGGDPMATLLAESPAPLLPALEKLSAYLDV